MRENDKLLNKIWAVQRENDRLLNEICSLQRENNRLHAENASLWIEVRRLRTSSKKNGRNGSPEKNLLDRFQDMSIIKNIPLCGT